MHGAFDQISYGCVSLEEGIIVPYIATLMNNGPIFGRADEFTLMENTIVAS
jgi:hypothetical protein